MAAIFQGFTLVAKVFQAGATTFEIVRTCNKDEKLSTAERVQLVANCAFAALQVLDIGFTGLSMAPKIGALKPFKAVHCGINAATGAADVSRVVTSKVLKSTFDVEDAIDILAVICLRAGDSCHHGKGVAAKDIRPILCAVNQGLTLASGGLTLTANCTRLYRQEDGLRAMGRALFSHLIARYSQLPVVDVPEEFRDVNEYCDKIVISMLNWQTLTAIPSFYWKDPQLSLFICKISGQPMRLAMKPISGYRPGLTYDHLQLEKWLATHPNENPPEWPQDLPFIPSNWVPDTRVQNKIDIALQQISQELHEFYQSFDTQDKAKNLHLSYTLRRMTDVAVTDKILRHLPPKISADVFVCSIPQWTFGEKNLPAKQITIRHQAPADLDNKMIQQFFAAILPISPKEEFNLKFWNLRKFHIVLAETGDLFTFIA